VIAADTSVVVAAFASWHEHHEAARAGLAQGVRLIGHVALETMAVLTRLPWPHRAPAVLVARFIGSSFRGPVLGLAGERYQELVADLAARSIVGGAVYDALVGAVAADAGATLLTLDRRALPVYEALGVDVHVLA
jgi:predicted nucleic acid-binding protein